MRLHILPTIPAKNLILGLILALCSECGLFAQSKPQDARGDSAVRPNVLFISVDDLNDWIGCMGGHPQVKTPNLDRLAASGQLFTNAHCPAPACNPSRSAIMSGIAPNVSGIYDNRQKMRELIPRRQLIPKYFSNHGYWSAGSGKILHYFIDAGSWDQYFPRKETENPFPRTRYPDQRPVSLPRGGPWQYVETDWGPLDVTDREFGGDWSVSEWIGEQLKKKHDRPFFLACGIYRPHEPWFVPKKYFEPFPLEEIKLPPGYKIDDLDDLPNEGKRRGPNRYFAHIRKHTQWKQAIQGYLASIAFADAMVGRVLDALDAGPNRNNTIVVLWSDHGWHLGEKQHWQKFTAWRVCTRVPLMVRVPKDTIGLKSGTKPGTVCDQPVNLLSLFPTLIDLAALPRKESNNAPSLLPLLKDANARWDHVAVTHLNRPGNYSISERNWRYIHYANGGEELYHIKQDPFEWTNLAQRQKHVDKLKSFRMKAPTNFAKYVPAKKKKLSQLKWHPLNTGSLPKSKPTGDPMDVHLKNDSNQPVVIYRVDKKGKRHSYGTLESGWFKPYRARSGEIWLVVDQENEALGYFKMGNQISEGNIPRID